MAVQRRRHQAISAIDKQRIVDAFEDPEKVYLEMTNTLGIPRGTAWSIVRRCQLAGGEVIVRRRGGGRPIKIDRDAAMSCETCRAASQFHIGSVKRGNAP